MAKKILPILALVAALVASIYTKGFTEISLNKDKSLAQAKESTSKFIDEKLVQGQREFEIKEIKEEEGLYKLTVDIEGQEIISYVNKELTQFFPSAYPMNEQEQQEQQADTQNTEPQEIPQQENPEVILFTQSFCPYGNQAEDIMKPVAELLGDAIEIKPRYVLYENYQGGGEEYCIDEESKYCSMHGVDELKQNIRERCVYENQNDKFWNFVSQVNTDCTASDVETCWETAAQEAGVNTASVKNCYEQNYLAYAEEDTALNSEYNVTGSPTLLINGVKYQGQRSPENFKNAICSGFSEKPEACNETLEGAGEVEAAQGGC